MTSTFYASLSGAMRGAMLSLKYNRDIAHLLDNDAVKLKAFQDIIDAALEKAKNSCVKEYIE
jgi:hypothetical protein